MTLPCFFLWSSSGGHSQPVQGLSPLKGGWGKSSGARVSGSYPQQTHHQHNNITILFCLFTYWTRVSKKFHWDKWIVLWSQCVCVAESRFLAERMLLLYHPKPECLACICCLAHPLPIYYSYKWRNAELVKMIWHYDGLAGVSDLFSNNVCVCVCIISSFVYAQAVWIAWLVKPGRFLAGLRRQVFGFHVRDWTHNSQMGHLLLKWCH